MKTKHLKLIAVLFAVFAIAASILSLASCSDTQNDTSSDVSDNSDTIVYYTVKFDLVGGVVDGKDLTSELKVKAETEIAVNDYLPKKEGFVFGGYKCGDALYKDGDKIAVTKDITLVAEWTENAKPETVTITFDVAGGVMNDDKAVITKGETAELAQFVPTKEGFTFGGWQCGETVYAANDTITADSDMTLTAIWTEVPVFYTVRFDLCGGTVDGNAMAEALQIKKGAFVDLSMYPAAKDGFVFGGYKCGETVYKADERVQINEDIVFEAVWTAIPTHTVRFDLVGGEMDAKSELDLREGTRIRFSKYIPTKEGFVFVGWKDSDGRLYTSDERYKVVSDVTFTAEWKKAETDASYFEFTLSEDGESYILSGLVGGYDFALEDVVVPGTYNGKPITEIGSGVFSYISSTKTVDLTNCVSLVKLGARNFNSCQSLCFVDLSGCSKLTEIGSSCFNCVPSLTEIGFKGLVSLKAIGSTCFYGYNESTSMPLGALDLTDCVSLETVGQMSFWYLDDVRVLDFSKTKITAFERQTVRFCGSLETICLPATLRADGIGSEFLTDADALKEIKVDALSIYLTVSGGALCDIDKTVIIKYPAASDAAEFIAPMSVKRVMSEAFENANNLTVIDLTACKIENVERRAFANCGNATVKVPFSKDGKDDSGNSVTLGNDWNSGVKVTEYAKVIEFKISGLLENTTNERIEISAEAYFGDDKCTVSVFLNDKEILPTDGKYILSLVMGENKVVFKAAFGDRASQYSAVINRLAGDPTVTTTLKDGVVTWYGTTLDFVITAKDASGKPLSSENIEIKYNWGYGNQTQTNGVTLIDNADGTVTAKVAYDFYYEMFYFEGDTEITLTVVVKDGTQSASVSYKIDWREDEPKPTVTTTLKDGVVTWYSTTLDFVITAKDASGKPLSSENIEIKYNWGYGNQTQTNGVTLIDNADGTVTAKVAYDFYYEMFYFEGDTEITLTVVVKDGTQSASVSYKIDWREDEP